MLAFARASCICVIVRMVNEISLASVSSVALFHCTLAREFSSAESGVGCDDLSLLGAPLA